MAKAQTSFKTPPDKRPERPMTQSHDSYVTTPSAATMIALLGPGGTTGSLALSRDEVRRVARVYGKEIEGGGMMVDAGNARDMFREATVDGLRMFVWFSRYVKPGTDAMKVLVQVAREAGFDVDPEDAAWADKEDD